jgi:hypothetical protein
MEPADPVKVAALYVQPSGVYSAPDLVPGVQIDPWDEARAARAYPGPWPVVAHPPCARWCRLAAFVEAIHGHKRGDDNGTFAAALAAVRAFGGVLEHPAASYAWPAHGIPRPLPSGGWSLDIRGGWVCQVNQRNYGHQARKPTWLYYIGDAPPPSLEWGAPAVAPARAGKCARSGKAREGVELQSRRQRDATPAPFARLLVELAASARRVAAKTTPASS